MHIKRHRNTQRMAGYAGNLNREGLHFISVNRFWANTNEGLARSTKQRWDDTLQASKSKDFELALRPAAIGPVLLANSTLTHGKRVASRTTRTSPLQGEHWESTLIHQHRRWHG